MAAGPSAWPPASGPTTQRWPCAWLPAWSRNAPSTPSISCNGRCFDIGNTVRAALKGFEQTGDPFSGSPDPHTAGNGSLMRLAPVPVAFWRDPRRAIAFAADSSRTTHAAPAAVDACRYFAGLIVGALSGAPKEELLSPRYCPVPRYWEENPLTPAIDAVASGSFLHKSPPAIRGSGYVVHSLEAALWAFHHSTCFRDGCLQAVNLGEDADTTAAVYGQLAGAYYGEGDIPARWRFRLAQHDAIVKLADQLAELAGAL